MSGRSGLLDSSASGGSEIDKEGADAGNWSTGSIGETDGAGSDAAYSSNISGIHCARKAFS
jgi:hypothetical protein